MRACPLLLRAECLIIFASIADATPMMLCDEPFCDEPMLCDEPLRDTTDFAIVATGKLLNRAQDAQVGSSDAQFDSSPAMKSAGPHLPLNDIPLCMCLISCSAPAWRASRQCPSVPNKSPGTRDYYY